MKSTLETRLGIFFALALIAAIVLFELAGGVVSFGRGVRVVARFDSVMELQKGSPVKLGGVQIGEVKHIAITNNQVAVTLKLRKIAEVKTDSKASVRFAGLLGQNYVSLSFGSPGAPQVTDGTELEAAVVPDLAAIMEKLDAAAGSVGNITNILGGESFQNLLGPFTDFLKENSPRLTAILGNVQVISKEIAEGKGTIGKLVADETLYTSAVTTITNMSATAEEIQGIADDARAAVAARPSRPSMPVRVPSAN
jgi:phospholipid/cholesterol/gamma-HCH transport system substrate-binding protein